MVARISRMYELAADMVVSGKKGNPIHYLLFVSLVVILIALANRDSASKT